MSYYIDMVSDAILFMEQNLSQPIQLSGICEYVHMSEFHFNRLFSVITGISPKKYLIRRRLTQAVRELRVTNEQIIDIAMKWGFNYSEDFNRTFKKYFSMSPFEYRNVKGGIPELTLQEPIQQLSYREFVNRRGRIELKVVFKTYEEIKLCGNALVVSKDHNHYSVLQEEVGRFLKETANLDYVDRTSFFSLVKCFDEDKNQFDVFLGRRVEINQSTDREFRITPKGWYACFKYDGEMQSVYDDFERDLYTWVVQKDIRLRNIDVNMISHYDVTRGQSAINEIRIPIEPPTLME